MNKLLILSLIAGLLLLASCAANPGNSAGRVNGTNIPNDEFVSAYRGHYANFSFSTGRSPDQDEKTLLYKETWKNITRYVILKDYYQKYKITANAREVIDTLSTSIPAHILSSNLFKTNGKFDKQLYLQSLTTDRPENLAPLRRHYQENLIPILKLQAKLIENELISPAESKQIAKILASNADMELFIFDPAEVKVVISENEIASYYSNNLSRFNLKQYHKLAYSLVPVVPDKDDHLLSKVLADSVCAAINNGAKAEDIIHATNSSSGLMTLVDNGYVKTADLPADLQQEFSALPDGACSPPQRSETGWTMYQKLQSTKSLTQYRTIIVQSLARTSTLATPEAKARNLMNLALSIGLNEAAAEFDLNCTVSEALKPDSLNFSAPELKKQILKKLRTAPTGAILEPLYSTTLSAWIVIEVLDNQTREVQSLDEVKSQITSELIDIRRKELNLQRAQSWTTTQRLLSSTLPPHVLLSGANIDTVWQGKALASVYYQAAKAYMNKKEFPAVEHNGVLIVPVVKELRFTDQKIPPEQIRKAYVQTLPTGWFDTWLATKVKEAKVFIYNTP
jgi:hypothetical protein